MDRTPLKTTIVVHQLFLLHSFPAIIQLQSSLFVNTEAIAERIQIAFLATNARLKVNITANAFQTQQSTPLIRTVLETMGLNAATAVSVAIQERFVIQIIFVNALKSHLSTVSIPTAIRLLLKMIDMIQTLHLLRNLLHNLLYNLLRKCRRKRHRNRHRRRLHTHELTGMCRHHRFHLLHPYMHLSAVPRGPRCHHPQEEL